MLVPLLGRLLVLASVVAAPGCGRVGFEDRAVDEVQLSADGPLEVPAGSTVAITVTFLPDIALRPHATVTLTASEGVLRSAGRIGRSIDVTVRNDGTLPPLRLTATLDVEPGHVIHITGEVPVTGDTLYDVVEGGTRTMRGYTIPVGFVVDEPVVIPDPVRDALTGRAESLAFPPESSALGTGIHVGLGAPPAVYGDADGTLVLLGEDTDPGLVDERLSQMAIPLPGKGYEEGDYLCTGSSGIVVMDSTGTFTPLPGAGSCEGMVFDWGTRLDYDVPFGSPLYYSDTAGALMRRDSAAGIEVLASDLPRTDDGLRVIVCPKDYLESNLILLVPGPDGVAWHVQKVVPFAEPVLWLEGLPTPQDAVFSKDLPYGWLMLLALEGADEVRAYRRDGSSFPFLTGISQPTALAFRDNELWILGRGTGELIRVRPR